MRKQMVGGEHGSGKIRQPLTVAINQSEEFRYDAEQLAVNHDKAAESGPVFFSIPAASGNDS